MYFFIIKIYIKFKFLEDTKRKKHTYKTIKEKLIYDCEYREKPSVLLCFMSYKFKPKLKYCKNTLLLNSLIAINLPSVE